MPRLKKRIWATVRTVLPLAILAWLVCDVRRHNPDVLARLLQRPQHPWLLAASVSSLLAATSCTFVRWFLLVRALDIPFTLGAAFRLGFLGCLLNFVGPGAVGGDVFKAYFVARRQSSRRIEAVATILLDRVVGLFALLVVASLAIALLDLSQVHELSRFLRTVQGLTLAGGCGLLFLLLPAKWTRRLFGPLTRLPLLGPPWQRVVLAWELYRRRRRWLVVIAALSLTVHVLVALAIHWADRAIYPRTPTLREHLAISPLAGAAGGLPVPGGLGTYELAMHYLYSRLPREPVEQGQGLGVALCYRLMTILIAAVGAVFYALHREELATAAADLEAGGSPRRQPPYRS